MKKSKTPKMPKKVKALISVADKKGIIEFVRELEKIGYEIIATGGTQRLLKENNIEAIKIEDYTQSRESERVKTLNEKIAREILETGEIGLVVCNLYPFFSQRDKTISELIEFIDIGGVTLIRAGAKNFKKVGVVYDPSQYSKVIEALKNSSFNEEFRYQLACEAFDYIAWYDTVIATHFAQDLTSRKYFSYGSEIFIPMRYGENPHQCANFYLNSLLQDGFKIHGGKAVSYNNILDAEIAFGTADEFGKEIACAIIKHQTPCGVAIGDTVKEAFEKAYLADSTSAFGGIVGINQVVDEATAQEIKNHFFELVIAPEYKAGALEILHSKKNLRIIEIKRELITPITFRSVFGGILVQSRDHGDFTDWHIVTKRAPTDDETQALKFAWKVAKWARSNAIVLTIKGQTLGIGAGQTSRVGAVEIAVRQAGKQAREIVMASDAFFPFRDGIDVAAKAGVTAVIQPGGSKRDEEVITACNEHNMAMVFTGMRHFRH